MQYENQSRMSPSKYNKLTLLLVISTIFILVYRQCITYYTQYQLENSNIDALQYDEITFPLTWEETDQKLFDLDFQYVIKSHMCRQFNREITAVIIVTSYFGDVELRSAMRRAFNSNELLQNFNLTRVFLLGLSPAKETYVTQKQVQNEAERFGDIVQGNFQEAYRNLTYKHLMGLLWASYECHNAKFIMKMDDDIVVNMHKLHKDISQHLIREPSNLLAGFQLTERPVRNTSSKWYVNRSEYPPDDYPPYLSGWFYITTPETAKRLLHIGRKSNYFWIDDVFVTGIIAKRLRIKHLKLNYFFGMNHLDLKCCMEERLKYNSSCKFIFGPNGGENNLFYEFNLAMQPCDTCSNSTKCEDSIYKGANKFEGINTIGVQKANGTAQIYNL